jgi:hypothetical protein
MNLKNASVLIKNNIINMNICYNKIKYIIYVVKIIICISDEYKFIFILNH